MFFICHFLSLPLFVSVMFAYLLCIRRSVGHVCLSSHIAYLYICQKKTWRSRKFHSKELMVILHHSTAIRSLSLSLLHSLSLSLSRSLSLSLSLSPSLSLSDIYEIYSSVD